MQAFMDATHRSLSEDEKAVFREAQRQANRWTYLGSGMSHPNVLATLERLGPAARRRVEGVVPAFS